MGGWTLLRLCTAEGSARYFGTPGKISLLTSRVLARIGYSVGIMRDEQKGSADDSDFRYSSHE